LNSADNSLCLEHQPYAPEALGDRTSYYPSRSSTSSL
jgi:hypothetical protein